MSIPALVAQREIGVCRLAHAAQKVVFVHGCLPIRETYRQSGYASEFTNVAGHYCMVIRQCCRCDHRVSHSDLLSLTGQIRPYLGVDERRGKVERHDLKHLERRLYEPLS